MTKSIFRYEDGLQPNVVAIGYSFGGYCLGLWLLTRPEIVSNAIGVVLLAHALVISAYLLHECAHGAIFTTAAANDRLGVAVSWLNGACVGGYHAIKAKHLRHHADRLDVVTFSYRDTVNRAPRWVARLILALEWAYVPAVEFLMRALIVKIAFARNPLRVAVTVAIRIALFAALAAVSPKALLLYAVSFILMIHVLRFFDAFQHTYEVFVAPEYAPAPVDPRRDRRYEHLNTYSNLVSRTPWLNLLALNFPYHNAHHARPAAPWHRLPKLHADLYGAADPQVITCRELLAAWHRHRVARVLAEDYGWVAPDGDRVGNFLGAVGVSFLTAA